LNENIFAANGRMAYGYTYLITNLINGKKYYGQTRQPPTRRWGQHKTSSKKGGKMVIYNAMRKHGLENFKFEVVAEHETLEEMNKSEEELIAKDNTLVPNGYNAAKGGNNYEKTPETCKKISDTNKGRVISQEWREKIAKANTGRKNTVETLEKMSKAQKGRVITEGAKEKLRAANLGKKQSPETIAKKRAARTGVPWSEKKRASMVGKKHTLESIQKMKEAQKGRIIPEETKQKMREAKKAVRKLTDEQISEIKENKENLLQSKLSEKYNVSKQLINNIVKEAQKGRIIPEETKQKMYEARRQTMREVGKAFRKLTDEQISEIKENNENLLQCKLAEKYNVSKQLINNIVNGKRGY